MEREFFQLWASLYLGNRCYKESVSPQVTSAQPMNRDWRDAWQGTLFVYLFLRHAYDCGYNMTLEAPWDLSKMTPDLLHENLPAVTSYHSHEGRLERVGGAGGGGCGSWSY